MEREAAAKMISTLIQVEVSAMKQIASRGEIGKGVLRDERKAVSDLFAALTGESPTDEELTQIIK